MITIDTERFRRSFETYSEIGATERGGLHRLTLGDADREARDRFVDDLEELGLDVRVDAIGNVFGRRPGTDPDTAPVLVGSHLDSQPYGGRFDGQLGVLTALETLRALEDADVQTHRPIEIVNWTNEEGSRFQHAMLGSAVFVGETDLDEALDLTDADDVRLGDELERIGYAGERSVGPQDLHAHLELHVEQGPRLEDRGTTLGVVDGVFAIRWLEATIRGESDHAGPTPMHGRRDAMAAAADAVSEINRLPNRLSEEAVATVGRVGTHPDSINVIPSEATFTVDLRAATDDVVRQAAERTEAEIEAACSRHDTTYTLEERWRSARTEFSPAVCRTLERAAETHETSFERLISGAGHDAKYVNEITPTAMLFVPSVDGKTHNEAEFTEWDDCVAGAQVYATATADLASEQSPE